VQTVALLSWIERRSPEWRTVCIPNAARELVPAGVGEKEPFDRPKLVISVGRLAHQKGVDILLRAFSILANDFPQWTLAIIGDGPEGANLAALAEYLHLQQSVSFLGLVRDPTKYMLTASLFVMSSRHEGFPNALLEAMSCGTPVISTNCPSGPSEIIRDGIDGILVPTDDVEALAKAMRSLMADPELRQRLGKAATSIRDRFAVEYVMNLWEKLLD
jgi:GalNAc-alpha-(1->4)-GalNAc-alpha-(1->3)-diNAcBac-PP-undecaprenol alpha-1,4-N-acetyl-D-galactosaminyltransferase